ncbi:MAG: VWA domain-containing protein, partial [Proteobacteria bacterium]|nr:VWA domain-containing protein [Pseudomonadota bacterium]
SNIREILLFTQKGRFMRGILNRMGMDELEQDLNRLGTSSDPGDRQIAEELTVSKALLMDYVRNFVEKQYALFAGSVSEEILERFLKDAKLSNVEQRDFQRMQVLIKKLVKRLNDLHSRRKRIFRKGLLDLKKTLRVNMAYQGIIMEPQWKTKKVDRPDIVAICDVSRSVENVVRFFLMFLYSLNDSLARVRSFAFCTNLVEVTHVFENYPIEEALNRVLKGIEIDLQFASTDYGAAFGTFREKFLDKVTNKTTILILGDARNNFGKPNTDTLRLMQERSKRIVWLNPEQRSLWGTGDSEMKRYAPYCFFARECNTVNHIQRVIDFLLRTRQ